MNQLLEKLRGLDVKYLYMVLALLVVVVFAADYALIMRLQVGLIKSLDQRSVQLKKEISDLSLNQQRLTQFKGQLDIVKQTRSDFEKMVHRKDDIPGVLRKVSSMANEYGIKIDQLMPQPLSGDPLVKNEDGKYFGLMMIVRARCGFHQFGRFIDRLEKERLFWTLDELTISADDSDPRAQQIKMDMRILILEQ